MFRSSALGGVGASAVLHTSLFAAFALFMPALAATDAEASERDRIVVMQRYLDASAESEKERMADVAGGGESGATQDPTPSGGARAEGADGKMGGASPSSKGHYSVAGTAKREDATLDRQREAAEARDFGFIGVVSAGAPRDLNAPTVPWDSVLNGSDAESHNGNFWDSEFGDSTGTGLGLSSGGLGGGGSGQGVGINDFGSLGRSLDGHVGPGGGISGIGGCGPGRPCGPGLGRPHKVAISMRMPTNIETNGRLMPEIIQRIVRQNQGRFRNCYEMALGRNPGLEGRVAVKFVIDRTGGVSMAADSGSDLPDNEVRTCVTRSFYGLSFPAPQGGTVTVTYPIMFTPS